MALSAPQMAGDQLNPADIENHTIIVVPVEFVPHLPTVHTKAGEESPAIRVNVADLSAQGGEPVIYRGVLWFNVQLYNGLKRQIGQTVLGRMVKGQAQTGKNPPWILLDLLTNPNEKAWVDYAESFLAGPVGSGFEIEGQREAANAGAAAQVQAVTNPPASAPPAPPSAPPAPAGPPAPPAGPPATYAPPAAPVAGPPAAVSTVAPAAVTPAPAAPAGDLAAQLAGLPPEEVAKMLAALSNQGNAAH